MKHSANDRGARGNAPAGIQSLTRSFSMYITYVYCAIIEPRLWNIVPGTKKKKKKLCRAEIVSAGRPRPAPPTVATTLLTSFVITSSSENLPVEYKGCERQSALPPRQYSRKGVRWEEEAPRTPPVGPGGFCNILCRAISIQRIKREYKTAGV